MRNDQRFHRIYIHFPIGVHRDYRFFEIAGGSQVGAGRLENSRLSALAHRIKVLLNSCRGGGV